MLTFILTLLFGALPFKQIINDTERLCMKDGYFIINWKGSPVIVCEDPDKENYCYIMNPFDTVLRLNNAYVRILQDGTWLYDLGKCHADIPLQ
jgi:hypothetical protein